MKRVLGLMVLLVAPYSVAQEPVRVQLDETGITNWRVLNSVRPLELKGRALEVVNITGDRTFVVTIPYEIDNALTPYLAAHVEVGDDLTVEKLICRGLNVSACDSTWPFYDPLRSLRTLKGFREVLDKTTAGDPATCLLTNDQCGSGCQDIGTVEEKFDDCSFERLFWVAACHSSDDDVISIALQADASTQLTNALEKEAALMVSRLFHDRDAYPSSCSDKCASCRREEIEKKLMREQNVASDDIFGVVDTGAHSEILKRFRSDRVKVAKAALATAAEAEMDGIVAKFNELNAAIEAERRSLERRINFGGADDDVLAGCYMRELEVAARLLASYTKAGTVPFSIPQDVKTPCWRPPAALTEAQRGPELRALDAELREQTLARARNQARILVPETAVDILDCKVDGQKRVCVASAVIPPNQRAVFTQEALRHHPKQHIQFRVAYFGETEIPPNSVGHVKRDTGLPDEESGSVRIGFGASTTSAQDLPSTFQQHTRHTGGTGSLSFQYAGLTRVDVSATLQFKNGDFGGPDATNQISATAYQAKISSGLGLTFQSGRMKFATPSAGIAVNERGEGIRLGAGWGTASYIIRRESDVADGSADVNDDDSDVYLVQLNPPIRGLRNFLATFLYGEERKDRIADTAEELMSNDAVPITYTLTTHTVPIPYSYATFGAEARVAIPKRPNGVMTFAAYHSLRNMRTPSVLAEPRFDAAGREIERSVFGTPTTDGEGTVGLVTFTYTGTKRRPLTDPPNKTSQTYAWTAWLGGGSGDDPETATRDDGYLGETAGYSNDLIFLSQISKSKNAPEIGRGLSNKYYVGAQYSDSRISPLATIAGLLNAESDIQSRSTVISSHWYRFAKPVNDRHAAGVEVDLTFNVEVPKNVTWTLTGGFFRPGPAIEHLPHLSLDANPWMVMLGVAINLEAK
jgi:hypothetical protein